MQTEQMALGHWAQLKTTVADIPPVGTNVSLHCSSGWWVPELEIGLHGHQRNIGVGHHSRL